MPSCSPQTTSAGMAMRCRRRRSLGSWHEAFAAVDRQGLLVGGLRGALLVGERGEVGAEGGVGERQLADLRRRHRADVGDLLAVGGLDADGVDQHQRGHAAAVVAQRHLGADPAAERAADDHDAGQVELVEQVQVGVGEVGDGVEAVRARRAVEAGVRGHDVVGVLGQGAGQAEHGARAGAAVQVQDGRAVGVRAELGDGQAHAGRDGDGAGGRGGGGRAAGVVDEAVM